MNRETKRMLQRQGQLGPDGQPAAPADGKRRQQQIAQQPRRAAAAPRRERTSPVTFLREVRGELRRVAWPTREEVVNYTTIVLITLAVLMAFVFVVDFGFAKSVLFLFEVPE